MHCSADFEEPVDATEQSGGEVTVFADQDTDDGMFAGDDPREAESTTGTVQTNTGTVETDTGTVDSTTGSPAETAEPVDSFTPEFGGNEAHPAIDPLLGFIDASEGRRQALAVGIPAALFLLLDSATANLTGVILAACIFFALYLFRRADAAETLGRGATGAGLLILAVRMYDVTRVSIGDGLTAAADLALGSALTIAIGVVLVVAGRWIGR